MNNMTISQDLYSLIVEHSFEGFLTNLVVKVLIDNNITTLEEFESIDISTLLSYYGTGEMVASVIKDMKGDNKKWAI